ncbi:hypothetical protein ACFL6I_01290 [candidate division KSB1 bacterium]
MEHFYNRQNPLQDTISDQQMDILFKNITANLGKEWLESDGVHPLQVLWRRKDALSTNELFTFASALNTFQAIDSNWITHQIKQICSKDSNNQKGAFFELIGLNLFSLPLCSGSELVGHETAKS